MNKIFMGRMDRGEGSVGADTGTVYRQFYREQEVTRALVYRLRKVTGPESQCNAAPRLPPLVEILSWFDSWGARVRVARGSNVVPVVLLQSGPSTATIVVNGRAPDGLLMGSCRKGGGDSSVGFGPSSSDGTGKGLAAAATAHDQCGVDKFRTMQQEVSKVFCLITMLFVVHLLG